MWESRKPVPKTKITLHKKATDSLSGAIYPVL